MLPSFVRCRLLGVVLESFVSEGGLVFLGVLSLVHFEFPCQFPFLFLGRVRSVVPGQGHSPGQPPQSQRKH